MRRTLKFLHSIAAIGMTGALDVIITGPALALALPAGVASTLTSTPGDSLP